MNTVDIANPPAVLIVDDSPDLVDLLTHLIVRQGMTVVSAYNGQGCLEKIRQQPIDVIVLDVMMPGMDGLEVCAALRKIPEARFVPIILLTAKDDVQTRLAGLELGVSEFVVKPVRGKDLLSRIRTQVEVSRGIRAFDQVFTSS